MSSPGGLSCSQHVIPATHDLSPAPPSFGTTFLRLSSPTVQSVRTAGGLGFPRDLSPPPPIIGVPSETQQDYAESAYIELRKNLSKLSIVLQTLMAG